MGNCILTKSNSLLGVDTNNIILETTLKNSSITAEQDCWLWIDSWKESSGKDSLYFNELKINTTTSSFNPAIFPLPLKRGDTIRGDGTRGIGITLFKVHY